MDWQRNYRPGAGRRAVYARLCLPGMVFAALLGPVCARAAPLRTAAPPVSSPADSSPPQARADAPLLLEAPPLEAPPLEALPDALYPSPLPASAALAQWSAGERADLPNPAAIPGLASATNALLTLLSATSAPQFEAAGLSQLGEALRRDDQLGDQMLASLGVAIDSDLANRILAAAIRLPAGPSRVAGGRPFLIMGRVRSASGKPSLADPSLADASLSLASLASQNFGRPDTLAVGLREHVGDGAALRTDVEIRHAHGPLDVDFNLTGNQQLTAERPMALAYTGAAFVSLGDSVKVGMTAKGDLGTISAPSAFRDQTGSAVAKWRLLGKNSVLSAETGYDFPLGTPGSASQPQFHMSMNLNLKL